MKRTVLTSISARMLLPLPAALLLSLAACGQSNEEQTVEPDATDVSGGELIVTDETPAVPVDLPTTEMTDVPPEGTTPSPAPSPTASDAAQ